MENTTRTKGEGFFEKYLLSQGLVNVEFEKLHEGKSKRPDYTVQIDGREYLFDVKDFEPQHPIGFGSYDPHDRIRERIDEARDKFKEYKSSPCCLVLFNNDAPLIHLETPTIMLGAMYGDLGVAVDFDPMTASFDPKTARSQFLGRGKMIRPNWSNPQNTTISAMMTLRRIVVRQTDERIGVIVWENAFARIPFPRTLFCGAYDERYGLDGDEIARVFVGTRVSV
jgi:hypothetical protein